MLQPRQRSEELNLHDQRVMYLTPYLVLTSIFKEARNDWTAKTSIPLNLLRWQVGPGVSPVLAWQLKPRIDFVIRQ